MSPRDEDPETANLAEFVDREEELEELEDHMDMVLEGDGRLVLLKGEAGVGKTALADQIINIAESNGFKVLKGRCLYFESADPYIPFREALAEYFGEEEEKSKSTYSGVAASVTKTSTGSVPMSMIGLEDGEEKIDEEVFLPDKRQMMFDKVTRLLDNLSEKHPILIFLEDLQWIDNASSQLLHHITRHISESRVFILGAYRPEELISREEEFPLENVLDRMKGEKLVDEIEVGRLDFQPAARLIKKELETEDLPQSFLLMLYRETEGNPYYIVEILNSLVEEGIIDPYSYTWDPEKELSDIKIPSAIKDITGRRIERLTKEEKKVLMYASGIGTEFNFEVLETSINMDVIDLLDIIDDLKTHGLIYEKEDTEEEIFRFTHVQLKMTVYGNMGKSRKRVLHKQIGEALEDIFSGNLEEYYYSLSRHFYNGKDYEKAYDYSMKAGDRAINSLAYKTAVEHYEMALESLRKTAGIEDEKEKEMELLKNIGNLHYDMTNWEEANSYFEELLEIARDEGKEEMETLALRKLAHILKGNQNYEEAQDYYEKALEMAQEIEDIDSIADAQRGLGYIHWRDGELEEAIEHYEDAMEKCKEADNKKVLALTSIEMGNTYSHEGEYDLAIQYYKRSIDPLESQNAYRELSKAYNNIGDSFMKKEKWDTAIDYFDKCVETAKKIGNKRYVGWGYFNRAEAMAKSGRIEECYRYADRAEKIMENLNDKVGLAAVYRNKGLIHRLEGELDEGLEMAEKSLNMVEEIGSPFLLGEVKNEIGMNYKEQGKLDEAKTYLTEAKETLKEIGAEHHQFFKQIERELEDIEDQG